MFKGDAIVYSGPRYDGEYDARVAASGPLMVPGLINAHTYSPLALFRGLADDVDLHMFSGSGFGPGR